MIGGSRGSQDRVNSSVWSELPEQESMKWHHQPGMAARCCDTNTGTLGTLGRQAGGWGEAPALGLQGQGSRSDSGGEGGPGRPS